MLKKIFKQSFYLTFASFVSAISTLLVLRGAMLNLTSADYSNLVTAVSIPVAFLIFIRLGFNEVALKFVKKDNFSQWFSTLLTLRIFLATLIFIISWVFLKITNVKFSDFTSLCILLSLWGFAIIQTIQFSCTHLSILNKFSKSLLVPNLFQLFVILVLGKFVSNSDQFAFLIFLPYLGFTLFWVSFLIEHFRINFNFNPLHKQLLTKSLPLNLVFIVNTLQNKIDLILLGLLPVAFYSTASAAIADYSIITKFFGIFLMLNSSVALVIYPMYLKNILNVSITKTRKILLFLIYDLSILILSPVISKLLLLIFPSLSTQSVKAFMILLLSFPLYLLTSILQTKAISQNKEKTIFKIYLIAFLFNFSALIFLIPLYGLIGVVTSLIASETIVLFAFLMFL